MVRAIIDGRKTQTRRICKLAMRDGMPEPEYQSLLKYCPYGQLGERLWGRESWQYYDWSEEGEPCIRFASDNTTKWPEVHDDAWNDRLVEIWEVLSRDKNFGIDNRARDRRWRPSIHMPRWASRITLEVTGIRVERLNDISDSDSLAEGIYPTSTGLYLGSAIAEYRKLWEQINGAGSWDANPWVWVVEFRRIEQ